MSQLDRAVLFKPGPAFTMGDDGEAQFMYVIDASSVVGPRKATDRDKEAYSGEWAAFSETLRNEPDHKHAPADYEPGAPPAPAPKRRGRRPKVSHVAADDHSKDV